MVDAIFWMSVGVLLSGCVSAVAQELIDGLALPSIDEMEAEINEYTAAQSPRVRAGE